MLGFAISRRANASNGNGDVKRVNLTNVVQIKAMVDNAQQGDWDAELPCVEFTSNRLASNATGFTPVNLCTTANIIIHELPIICSPKRACRSEGDMVRYKVDLPASCSHLQTCWRCPNQNLTCDQLAVGDHTVDRQWLAHSLVPEQHALTIAARTAWVPTFTPSALYRCFGHKLLGTRLMSFWKKLETGIENVDSSPNTA